MNRQMPKSSMFVAGLCGCALVLGSVSLVYGQIIPPSLFRLCKHCVPVEGGGTYCIEWVCLSMQTCEIFNVHEILVLDCANP